MALSSTSSFGFYFRTLTKIIGQPRRFYSELPQDFGVKKSVGFLTASSIFFTFAALARSETVNPLVIGGIFFVNAVGMALIAAGIGYGVMVLLFGKNVSFARFFNIYALSTGVTLLASWIPFVIWITEPWKWWLVGTGMTRAFGFTRTQAVVVIGVSLGIMVLLFMSLGPVVSSGRQTI